MTIYNDRYEALPTDSLRLEEMKRDDVLFYREGLTTTVSVHRIPGSEYIYFKSNGKIDGSYGDALSQLMTSYIPMMLHPKAEPALTIGLGSGMSAKALATFKSLKEIEVIEIEPAMIEASKFFDRRRCKSTNSRQGSVSPRTMRKAGSGTTRLKSVSITKASWSDEERSKLMKLSRGPRLSRRDRPAVPQCAQLAPSSVLEDKRVRVIPTDGRNYILATPKYYDVITAEPSNPWIAGIANLYTREFYQVIKSKIKDDGIFAQWFHNYSMSPDDFRMVFRTFAEAFPHVSLWSMKESDFLLIGSKQEQTFDYAAVKEIYRQQRNVEVGSRVSGAVRCLCGAGILPHGQGRLSGVFQGRDNQYRRRRGVGVFRAQEPAPRDHRAQSADHDALSRRYSALAEKQAAAGPEAMHHYYMAQSYVASMARNRALNRD